MFATRAPRPDHQENCACVAGPAQRKKRRASSIASCSSEKSVFGAGFHAM